MADRDPGLGDLGAYGLLALPLAFGGLPLYIHAPDFMATERGVPLAALGLALFWLRLLDAALDPLAGWAGDRWPHARARFITLGAVLLALGVLAIFAPVAVPVLPWFVLSMVVASLGHSLISVNLLTIGGLWRQDKHQKSRISAARELFGLIGLILAVVLPSALAPVMGRGAALFLLALVLAVVLLLALPVFRRWLAVTRLQMMGAPEASPRWRGLLPFYLIALLVLLSAGFPAVLILMLVRDMLGVEGLTGAFLLAYFAAALPGAFVAGRMAGRFAPVHVWSAALLLSLVCFAFALRLQPGDSRAFLAICMATGFCFGADLVLPPIILSDRIDKTQTTKAATRAYAALGFLTKAALALAGVVALPLLQMAGFAAGGQNGPAALQALLYLYAGLPLVLRGGALGLLIHCHRRGTI